MASKGSCVCRQCEFLNDGCESCGKCFPRYRCVVVTYVPGQYSNTCSSRVSWKIAYDCEIGAWIRIPGTYLPTASVGVTVSIVRVSNTGDISVDCRYGVYLNDETTYVNINQLASTTFEVDGPDGGVYEVEITDGVGVCYPYALSDCSPCKCGTCMPSAYKIHLVVPYGSGRCGGDACGLAEWNSTNLRYEGTVMLGTDAISVIATPLASACVVHFEITGNIPDIEPFDLPLEGGAITSECVADAFSCKDKHYSAGPGEDASINRGQGSCVGEVGVPLADYEVHQVDEYNQPSLDLYVTDGSCDTCNETSGPCPGSCKDLDVAFDSICPECPALTGSLMSDCPDVDDAFEFLGPHCPDLIVSDSYTALSLDAAVTAYALTKPGVDITICQNLFYGTKDGVEQWSWPGSNGWGSMRVALCYVKHGCEGVDNNYTNPYHYAIWYEGYKNLVGYPGDPVCDAAGSSSITSGLVFPTYASCDPFILEFPFLDFNLAYDCPPIVPPDDPNPCEGQSGATVLRVTG